MNPGDKYPLAAIHYVCFDRKHRIYKGFFRNAEPMPGEEEPWTFVQYFRPVDALCHLTTGAVVEADHVGFTFCGRRFEFMGEPLEAPEPKLIWSNPAYDAPPPHDCDSPCDVA